LLGRLLPRARLRQLLRPADLTALAPARLQRHVWVRTPLLLLLNDQLLVYYCLAMINTALGLSVHSFFFVPLLLDIVVQSRLLQKVIEAVTINAQSLSLTFLLVLIVVYQFTIVGQLFYHEDYIWHYETAEGRDVSVDLCASTLECLKTTLYLGLNYDGLSQSLADLRDKVDHDPTGGNIRWTVDLLFYVVVIVMLLNIIFGIVIDTFAQQRDLQKQIKDDIDNVCFVCGIDRNTFDRKHPLGFEHHIRNEHNLWHYLSFMVHLRVKDVTDYTGPETYVRDMLTRNDFGFFPILKTSSIIVEDVSNEVLQDRIQALHQQAERHAERIEAQLEAQRSEMLELQRGGGKNEAMQ